MGAGVGAGATVAVGRGPFVFLVQYEKVELCKDVLFKLQKPKPPDDDCALLAAVLLIALIGVVLVMGIIVFLLLVAVRPWAILCTCDPIFFSGLASGEYRAEEKTSPFQICWVMCTNDLHQQV